MLPVTHCPFTGPATSARLLFHAGTGKSTTIWHVINSRVASDARVLVTSIRNQAIDAVTRKVESFGILVSNSQLLPCHTLS